MGFGPAVDEPMFWWDMAGGHMRPLHADERGSIVAVISTGGERCVPSIEQELLGKLDTSSS